MGVWDTVKGAYEMTLENVRQAVSFFDRPGIEKGMINIANGIPFAMERVTNSSVGIGGVYGTWEIAIATILWPDFWRNDSGTRFFRIRS